MTDLSELIPRDVLMGNPDRVSVKLSLDGRYLSYLAPLDGVMNIWISPRERPEDAHPITQDNKRGIF